MFTVVLGASGSGKSEYAEQLATTLHTHGRLVYIATMQAFDTEALQKIEKHKRQRAGKGFDTLECFLHLKDCVIPRGSTVLLDCMSNLAANEYFDEQGAGKQAGQAILAGISHVLEYCENLIIVTNDVFADGITYPAETMRYMQLLAQVNRDMARLADSVIECVYGIPLAVKK